MNTVEIRAMSADELEAALGDARKEMFNLRFQKSLGQVADTNRTRTLRRSIARIMTIRREREIWAAYEAGQNQADEA